MFLMPTSLILAAAAGAPWYTNPSHYVALCVILFFVVLVWKGAHKAIFASLDDRANKISEELEEARRLREEAQTLLASFQRKQKEAEEQAEDIVKQARHDAELMAAKTRKELGERLERRAAMAEAKIATAEAQALADVRARAADIAIAASESLLRDNMKAADHTRLVTDGIAQIAKTIN